MATTSPRRPMVTAHLTLELLESAARRGAHSTECSSCAAAFNSSSDLSTPSAVTQRKIASLQRALLETTAAASPPTHDPSDVTKVSLASLMKATNNPTSETVGAAASTSSSDDYSLGSWDETEDDDDYDDEEDDDRGRLGAAATSVSRLSREDSVPHDEEVAYGQGIRRQGFFEDERNKSTALDEFDHPALDGAAAALHGYVASEGDPIFLEKAYEIARSVAGSKHSLTVAFDACRMALAVGYVHTLTKGAPDMANTFAKQHSLCKLAQSLKAYWSTSPASTPEAMVEWEECMSSLLEVASSVALMTGERDVLSVLDIDAYSGVTEAIGAYLVRRPGVLQQYQDVGGACLRQHLLGTVTRGHADSE